MDLQYDIAFYECFDSEKKALQENLDPSLKVFFSQKTIQEENHTQAPAPLLCTRTISVIPPLWSDDIEAILTRSTGYDHILRYRTEVGKNIPGGYLPLYCNRAVAEHAILLVMALLKRLPQQIHAFSTFNRNRLTGSEIRGKTLVVLGVGNIGYEVAQISKDLGMECIGVDLDTHYDNINYLSLENAIQKADAIICTLNLNPSTEGLLNKNIWGKTKQGAVFVNISRGEISPFADLKSALDSGQLSGIGLDVFNEESNISGYLRGSGHQVTPELETFLELKDDSRVIFTPHNAFNTEEAVSRKVEQTVQQLNSWQQENKFIWPC